MKTKMQILPYRMPNRQTDQNGYLMAKVSPKSLNWPGTPTDATIRVGAFCNSSEDVTAKVTVESANGGIWQGYATVVPCPGCIPAYESCTSWDATRIVLTAIKPTSPDTVFAVKLELTAEPNVPVDKCMVYIYFDSDISYDDWARQKKKSPAASTTAA